MRCSAGVCRVRSLRVIVAAASALRRVQVRVLRFVLRRVDSKAQVKFARSRLRLPADTDDAKCQLACVQHFLYVYLPPCTDAVPHLTLALRVQVVAVLVQLQRRVSGALSQAAVHCRGGPPPLRPRSPACRARKALAAAVRQAAVWQARQGRSPSHGALAHVLAGAALVVCPASCLLGSVPCILFVPCMGSVLCDACAADDRCCCFLSAGA